MSKHPINRRDFLKQGGIVAGAAAGSALIGFDMIPGLASGKIRRQQDEDYAPAALTGKAWHTLSFTGDHTMDTRILFYLGHTWYQMAEIGECLDTASRIEAGDLEGWRREWYATADRLRGVAEASLAGGHPISAGEAYLRATSYYLAGLIYTESPDDPEMPRAARASAECFERALELLDIPGEPVQIPYEDTFLPGYFFRAGDEKAPTLIFHQGMDASVEETYVIAQGAVARGYHCLMFHHPGQGLALREQGLTFRPDWENVITPVVDYALTRSEVDADRIAVLGLSFGGALILRAMVHEKRVKICISNPPVYNWGGVVRSQLFGEFPEFEGIMNSNPEMFDNLTMQFLDGAPATYRWWFRSALWKFGQETPSQLVAHMDQYSLDGLLDQITCKVLVMDGEAEEFGAGDGLRVHEGLANSDYMLFTAEDTAQLHNQTGALAVANQRMFDWLDDNL